VTDVIDLFAGGAGGWHYGLEPHGLATRGLEIDRWAVATRHAAGHQVDLCDVTAVDPADYPCRVLTASPPCRPWSPGGLRQGELDRQLVEEAIDDLAAGRDTRGRLRAACTNEDSLLAAEPMRWARVLRPEVVLMEQVRAVLPLWEQYGRHLAGWGYSVWTGVLNAADQGLPQTRTRAILVASRVSEVTSPESTVRAHRAMADVLPGVRLDTALVTRRDSIARRAKYGSRPNRMGGQPAPTITGECWRWYWRHADGREEPFTPAQAAVLQGFPASHPWQGPKTRVALQIGNAIPKELADAAYTASLGAGQQLSLYAA
jgi:DNA (cytosine-5)-methyltransferase 1